MREQLKAWSDDVALRGPDAPRNDGKIKHLIEYLLTVYERFGNTVVTANLQWGATALHKLTEERERIAELEAQLAARPEVDAPSINAEAYTLAKRMLGRSTRPPVFEMHQIARAVIDLSEQLAARSTQHTRP